MNSVVQHLFHGLPHRSEKVRELGRLLNVTGVLEKSAVPVAARARRREDSDRHMGQAAGLHELDEHMKAVAPGGIQVEEDRIWNRDI
jgi:hypothetical protein